MSPELEQRCSEQMLGSGRFGAFNRVQCKRVARVARDGKVYCAQHDPEAKKARRAKSNAEWDRKILIQKAGWDVEAAAKTLVGVVMANSLQSSDGLQAVLLAKAELAKAQYVLQSLQSAVSPSSVPVPKESDT